MSLNPSDTSPHLGKKPQTGKHRSIRRLERMTMPAGGIDVPERGGAAADVDDRNTSVVSAAAIAPRTTAGIIYRNLKWHQH